MLEQRRVELSRLSKKLIAAQEEEKKRISKDVHDSLGQLAYLLSLNLSTLSKNPELKTNPIFIKTQEIIHQMLEDIRRISYDLRPPTLEEMELVSALRWLIEHSQREGLKINMGVKINSRIEFPYSVQVQIFRIAQEAINNILRHSNATEANIFLYESSDRFYIEITDNGRGFSYDPVQSEGIGLISMKERAESIGGNLKIVSAPNEGTTILLEIKK
jgi:two-component system sensor histidine kinase NreB